MDVGAAASSIGSKAALCADLNFQDLGMGKPGNTGESRAGVETSIVYGYKNCFSTIPVDFLSLLV